MSALDGTSIVLAGTFSGRTHGTITKQIQKLGGKVTKDITDNTTHLITIAGTKNGKVTTARSQPTISIVSIDWLDECESTNTAAKTDSFLIKSDDDVSQPSADGAVTDGAAAPRRSNRAAPASQNTQQDSESATTTAAAKRSRSVKEAKGSSSDPEADDPPAKKPRGRASAKAKKDEDVSMKDTDDTTKTDAKPAAKNGAKGKGAANTDVEKDKEPNFKTASAAKGSAPVDEHFPHKDSYHVYTGPDGTIYDGALNQTQIGSNSNKFYYVQLLRSNSNGNLFATWTRWGRVGENGQSKMVAGPGCSLDQAMREFESKFRAKSGLSWENRLDEPRNGKYTYIEKSYDEDKDDDKPEDGEKKDDEPVVKVESKLPPSLQSLMELIFNVGYMNDSMVQMKYDANKLPLGKLSKETLKRGYEVLKAIGDVLSANASASDERFQELSNRYYSIIPHAFGRGRPPAICSSEQLKREAELLDALGDLGIANNIIKATKGPIDEDGNPIHQLDARFRSLNLNTAEPLDHGSREFQLLSDYCKKTHGKTHYINLEIEDIFRIVRPGEFERWKKAGWNDYKRSTRLLLWHGSRTTNYGGILSQGLRIAPPEAPAHGTMFGKGIYLADMVTKSANYCGASASGNTGLLMLCETQVGNPMYELAQANYNADKGCLDAGRVATKGCGQRVPKSWMECSELGEWARGCYMPEIRGPGDATMDAPWTPPNAHATPAGIQYPQYYNAYSLQYNEYIVYDVSQVQIRYLFRCKFNNRVR
ncbi:PARP-domain-containing protein [Ascobolus immersus RN42]|uniref:Poly [ADP-ribose] polymerase n=1 Tax=Ascobolus immersus RN42 TaxID=1160509 RepID=A0A3N4IC06_ASCIM|nr:PARP-domain-containing protein [Ascobolus immersus RN42]